MTPGYAQPATSFTSVYKNISCWETMSQNLVQAYLRGFGDKYLDQDIFAEYPEARILPAYLKKHFAAAETGLDLGFGSGLWFYASFLPALKRLDGFDAYPEALEEADRIFECDEVPAGYRLAHAILGEEFGLHDLCGLKKKRGRLIIQDYREPWPVEIIETRYDLVTEHGGGLVEMRSEDEFKAVIRKSAQVLKPSGCMFFMNLFFKERSVLAEQLGKTTPPIRHLGPELYHQSVEQAGMKMIDFHAIDNPPEMPRVQTFFYGYAQK